METIKTVYFIFLTAFISILLSSCNEQAVGQPPTDDTPPGTIKNPVVKNIAGGAIISYDLPDDDDLLYVKAIYTINGEEKNSTASIYTNNLQVEGFGSTAEQTIKLYCVDRSQNISEPVEVKIQPETPPVKLIYDSFKMENNFGGVRLTWENEHRADVAIYLMAADSVGDINVADVIYTSVEEGVFNLRGFDTSERLFGAFVRDRWDNYSDTLTGNFIPMYEIKLDKSLFKREILQADNSTNYNTSTRRFETMWDDLVDDFGWHTGSGTNPMLFTIDLGVKVKLSRYTLWHRQNGWPFRHHNPKRWTIYGTEEIRRDIYDDEYWKGGFVEDWPLQLYCEPIKPSGLPVGENTQEDLEYALAGFDFEFPIDEIPVVRYVRFWVHETWGGGNDLHLSEISFYGEVVED